MPPYMEYIMIRFAVVGTNWITQRFIDAAHESGKMRLTAIYSRNLSQAKAFGEDYPAEHHFDSLEALAACDEIDAVYLASPNALHCEQALLFMRHGKHVICEKPLASNQREAEQMVACAREQQVVLFEAFKTAWLPNFLHLQSCLPRVGVLRRASFSYCQFSSRYPRYLAGENPNTFNPAFSNGSIMDIGYYCLASSVALWGEPARVTASASLLPSGVDGHGVVILHYDQFEVVITHSKVSDSALPSEIQGESGTLEIGKLAECQSLVFTPRGGQRLDITQPQHINTMLYEAEAFARLVEAQQVEHPGLERSLITARLLTEIRRQTGVIFPADTATA